MIFSISNMIVLRDMNNFGASFVLIWIGKLGPLIKSVFVCFHFSIYLVGISISVLRKFYPFLAQDMHVQFFL